MEIRRSRAGILVRTLAVIAVFAILATACGGGSDESAADEAPDTENGSPTVVGEIPTTAPLPAPDSGADDSSVTTAESAAGADGAQEDPWEVTVLHVKDDVQIVPVFDAPNGNNITLYDKNEIDGVELEYPLYAETVFGNRLALLVEEFDSTGNWAKVQAPVRPNNTTVWVQTAFFTQDTHNYHIEIDVSDAMVRVFRGEEEILQNGQLAVMGRDSRPTPVVRSYIDEKIPGEQLSPAYGTWVLSIAAFSEDLGTFGGGGMPKLALHGTNEPELMGQYVSSGCVRIPNEVVSFIADTVPVGTIVDIVP